MNCSYKYHSYFALGSLLVVFILLGMFSAASNVQSEGNNNKAQGQKKERFNEEDLKVEKMKGHWTLSTLPHMEQAYDPSVPIALLTVRTFYGQGQYAGRVKILEAKVQNRSQKLAQLLQFKWWIVNSESPETVLLEGVTPFLERQIKPNLAPIVNIPTIYFNKIAKPLLNNDELTGGLRLIVGVQEVRFADNTIWQLDQQTTFLKSRKIRPGSNAFGLPAKAYIGPASLCDNKVSSLNFFPYNEQSRLTGAAVFLASFQTSDPPCRENHVCDYDPVNNKNICKSLTNSFCDLGGCDPEGHCACTTGVGPCSTCPDNDGDGYASKTCGGEDCNDTPGVGENINPDQVEICDDGIDNDCANEEDCKDFSCHLSLRCACPKGGMSLIDNDGDGYCDDFDCDDGDPNVPSPQQCRWSPVLIDTRGDGFNLTDSANGVEFDLNSDGAREYLSWTLSDSDDAWLTLDRNGNGVVDSGQELFGNYTLQPEPPPGVSRNGFLALAEYDKPENGGNSNGVIDSHDSIFSSLQLWQDKNHNGTSEPSELHTLRSLGVAGIHLDYKESKKTDANGNRFRYRAKIDDEKSSKVSRWAWDVFLVPSE